MVYISRHSVPPMPDILPLFCPCSPSSRGSLPSNLFPFPLTELGCSRCAAPLATKSPQGDGGRIFTLLFRRRVSVLDLAGGDIDHQLGELGRIAGTFQAAARHIV